MGVFPTTQWTQLLEGKQNKALAWQSLLSRYWKPLYVFFRAKGLTADDAKDAVQGFALELMEKDALMQLTPEKGRLRGFLCKSAENYLFNEYEKASAQKRGGGLKPIPIDDANADAWAADAAPPETAFERAWAMAVFDRSVERLEQEWSGRRNEFEAIRLFFSATKAAPGYREVAESFQLSLPQLKSMLHRARARFRELVQEEVLDTVGPTVDVSEEMAHLLQVLSR